MTREKWNISGYDRDDAVRLCRRGLNPLAAVLLASRGIVTDDEISELCCGGVEAVTSPVTFADMDIAAERVRRAVRDGEHVAVYGDYDVDGITSSCLVAGYLRSRGVNCDIYIPERLEEGYGVKKAALKAISETGVTLVITVDCGITAAEEKEYAALLGMDMVITDHHEVSGEIPASPVVDPKRPDCPSKAKMLAGVGVAFKLVCAVDGEENTEKLLEEYGDLVAVGTIADVMPVTGENRVYIRNGLESVRAGKRPGLRELCAASGLEGKRITVTGVGYALAPRINAAGRLGGTDVAVKLLMTENGHEAAQLAIQLCALNKERQQVESEMLKEALCMLEKDPPCGKPIVLAGNGWHQGVAGIVASRVAERFSLPTVMICLKDGIGRGSCRSACGFNLFAALDSNKDLLLNYGGHEMAAGLTIDADKVGEFRTALGERYAACPEEIEEPELRIDFEVIKPEILTVQNIDALDMLEPYGTGNPQPVLCMKNVMVENTMALSEGKHTKMWISKDGTVFEAVFFGKSIEELGAEPGRFADAAFMPQVNEFRGRRSVQLYLVDFAAH